MRQGVVVMVVLAAVWSRPHHRTSRYHSSQHHHHHRGHSHHLVTPSLVAAATPSPSPLPEGILAVIHSKINGEIVVREETWTGENSSRIVERSMYFGEAVGAQSVVQCLPEDAALEHCACGAPECCSINPRFIPDGYLKMSLLSVPLHLSLTDALFTFDNALFSSEF
eukprot:c18737_g1_i1.p2 GENE.c18737_g1_i1~~c18737_g1_i1.p2  ORF type:complete len:167 (+),score=35.25 c18737_g1_i1:628-1128(+)